MLEDCTVCCFAAALTGDQMRRHRRLQQGGHQAAGHRGGEPSSTITAPVVAAPRATPGALGVVAGSIAVMTFVASGGEVGSPVVSQDCGR